MPGATATECILKFELVFLFLALHLFLPRKRTGLLESIKKKKMEGQRHPTKRPKAPRHKGRPPSTKEMESCLRNIVSMREPEIVLLFFLGEL